MITIPYEQLVSTILERKSISRAELDTRIKAKMDQLSGLISKEGAAHIVANELGIKLLDATGGKMEIGKILGGMRDIETVGKVLQVFEVREFQGKLGPGKVASMIIGDATGQIRVVLWNDMTKLLERISIGDIVKIIGGQARQNRDRRELHLNARSRLMINPPGEKVEGVAAPEALKRVQISELTPDAGLVELKATIVQVFDLRFYEVCPHCNRRVQQRDDGWECATHGIVTPSYSYALTFFADDGSGNTRAVCFGNTVEALTGKPQGELLLIKDDPSLFDSVRTELLGSQLLLIGRANKNEMFDRVEFIVRQAKKLDVDKEIELLKERAKKAGGIEVDGHANEQAQPVQAGTSPNSNPRGNPKQILPTTKNPTPPSEKANPSGGHEPPAPESESTTHKEDFNIDEELI